VDSRTNSDLAATRDGSRISYRLVPGNKQGGRVVLVHSLAMDKSFWNSTVAALDGAADVLVLDCRGHGASDKPEGPYRVEQFADDIADLMDHVGWKSAVIAGASMGGCVSLAFAGRHGARVDGLGLFDTTAWYGEGAPAAWAARAGKALNEGLAGLVGFQKTRWFGDAFRDANPAILEQAIGVFLANDLKAYAATCEMLGAADLRATLPAFDFPCEIRVGSEDYATPPEMARFLEANIKGSHLEIMEGVRHFSPLEVPAAIAEAVKTMLKAA
jgi:3-oxoadipate enol-lactonase